MDNIQDVTYVSVWDDGFAEIETKAKYDPDTKKVFDIEVVEGIGPDGEEVQQLDEEYILLPSGEKLNVEERDGDYFVI